MVNNNKERKVDFNAERKAYETVSKMTDLELAKIEVDEMHPLYQIACEEIDARSRGKNHHAIDKVNEQDEWDRSFQESQMRFMDRLWDDRVERLTLDRELFPAEASPYSFDDNFTAAAGFVDPEDYSERVGAFYP
jgi:hypothetical protein